MGHEIKKCLIVRKYGHLGDLLMMTPAVEIFSKNKEITLQIPIEYQEIFLNLPFIKEVIDIKKKLDQKNYDIIIDLSDFEFNYEQTHQPFINKTKIELFADGLNVNLKRKIPIINLSQEERKWAEDFVKGLPKKKTVLLAPLSKNPSRDWPLNKWKELIQKLKETTYNIVVIDKSLRWDDKSINFFNSPNLRKLFALVSKSDIIITQDSGVLHIGAAFGIKTIVLFGPIDHKMRTYSNCFEIHKETGCYPCWYKRCNEIYCLKLVEVSKVYEIFKGVAKC